jgi:hypothetical protein
MPRRAADILIDARPQDVFDLIHDYDRRLQWDPFLRRAQLLNSVDVAALGVTGRCVAKFSSGGLGMDFVYISFDRPKVAAIRMTSGPWLLREFLASLRQVPQPDGSTRVTYTFSFRVRPRWAAPLLEPIFARFFLHETRERLRRLKQFMERPGLWSSDGEPA